MAKINGKPSVYQLVEPPARAKIPLQGAKRGRQWEDVARSMVSEVAESLATGQCAARFSKSELNRDVPSNRKPLRQPKPVETPTSAPKAAPVEKVYAYLDVDGARKPIMIHAGDDLQVLANAQQRCVIGVSGKRETFYMPRKPDKVLVFTESQSHIRTQINAVDTPSERFDERCEDYADKYQVKVVAVFPDGSFRDYRSMSVSDRAYLRKYKPTQSQCRRCGSITCAGVGSTGIACGGKGGRK